MRAVAGLVVVLLVGLLALSGCGRRDANEFGSPESALMGFFAAVRSSAANPDAAWSFLGDDTRARLEQAQAQAVALGIEVPHPMGMLEVGWVPDVALVQRTERERYTGERAIMLVETALGETFRVEMERRGSRWTVELGDVVPEPDEAAAGNGADLPVDGNGEGADGEGSEGGDSEVGAGEAGVTGDEPVDEPAAAGEAAATGSDRAGATEAGGATSTGEEQR